MMYSNRHARLVVTAVVLAAFCLAPSTGDAASRKDIREFEKRLAGRQGTDPNLSVADVAGLHVVDCLLPSQVRRLGNRTYLQPRRPIKNTASECRLRGGEYVEFDRADYRTALQVWMASAEAGDVEAQTNVGEIFERGLASEPNYEAALYWYRQAAEKGYRRARFNLGTLYEQGLGVAKNPLEAMNWYRLAWGMNEDDLIYASAANKERETLRRSLQDEIDRREQQIQVLTTQGQQLAAQAKLLKDELDATARERQSEQEAASAALESTMAQIETMQALVEDLAAQQKEKRVELAALIDTPLPGQREMIASSGGLRIRTPETTDEQESTVERPPVTERIFGDVSLGNYYALLIGNEDYESLDNLQTPINDIGRARRILTERYGFTVFALANASNVAIMQAINDLGEILTEDDNLLIFFAGHGARQKRDDGERGFWLPRNAELPPRNTYWVANEFITGHLARLEARRVLVVADSCYAGLLSNEPSMFLFGADSPDYGNEEFLQFKLEKRSRLLLTSGGDRPVLDSGSGGHSVFASALLDALENNEDLLSSPELFMRVRNQVEVDAQRLGFAQRPELKTIKAAGHEVGDFFFAPI